MRRTPSMLVLAAATASLLTGPVNAAPPEVSAKFITTAFHRVGAGWVATVACRTTATPGDPQVVPVTATATCSVNDTERSRTMPGAVSESQVVSSETAPFTFCVTGSATFLDTVTDDLFTIEANSQCITFEA